jgi:hypothetical protein
MNNPALPHGLDHRPPLLRFEHHGKSVSEKFSASRLVTVESLDSDEESKEIHPTLIGEVFATKGQGPRKPKRIDWTDVAGPLTRRSQTDSIQRQSGLV